MRITDQYFWNFVFLVFFGVLIFLGTIILEGEAHKAYEELTLLDLSIISLASFRLIRLVVNDKVMAFFREQFWDAKVTKTNVTLVKPKTGPRRTIADLLSCPWCFGVWAAAMVIFFYLLTPYAFFPVLLLALSGVATFFHQVACVVGYRAEQLKNDSQRY